MNNQQIAKKSSFLSIRQKRSQIKLLLRDFVSSAARRWIVLAIKSKWSVCGNYKNKYSSLKVNPGLKPTGKFWSSWAYFNVKKYKINLTAYSYWGHILKFTNTLETLRLTANPTLNTCNNSLYHHSIWGLLEQHNWIYLWSRVWAVRDHQAPGLELNHCKTHCMFLRRLGKRYP